MSSVDNDLISVDLHVVKGPSVWHNILRLNLIELRIYLYQRVVELTAGFALIRWMVTSEHVDILANAAYRMPFDPLIRDILITHYLFPSKYLAIYLSLALTLDILHLFLLGILYSDDLFVDHDVVIESAVHVDDCGIVLVY